MKKTVKYGIDFPIWNGGNRLIGIALWRIKKYNLNIYCNYRRKDGTRLWEGELYINEKFATKYPYKEFNGKNGKFTVYQIPLADIQKFNQEIQDKLWALKNAKITSPIYSGEQIAQILKDNPNIKEIADFFGGGELLPE